MKLNLLLIACLLLAGCCGSHDEGQREVLNKLDALKSELGKQETPSPVTTVRWAIADKSKINTTIFVWTRDKQEQLNRAETVSPDIAAKLQAYESLRTELQQMRISQISYLRPMVPLPGAEQAPPTAAAKTYTELEKRLAEAKAPVADIVDRRDRQATQLREQYSVERLAAEYAKGRYDLVLDTREKVLYQGTGEVPDITEGIVTLFWEKTKR